METMESSVRSLERQVRVLKAGLLALLVLLGALAVGPTRAAVLPVDVEAQRFVLKDAGGAIRAVLEVDSRGSARLTFYREDGSKALSLSEHAEVVPVR
jgi:hypothetical protein